MQRLKAHSSSVYCVCAMDPYLISVGGKSEIFIWRLEAGIFQFAIHLFDFSLNEWNIFQETCSSSLTFA